MHIDDIDRVRSLIARRNTIKQHIEKLEICTYADFVCGYPSGTTSMIISKERLQHHISLVSASLTEERYHVERELSILGVYTFVQPVGKAEVVLEAKDEEPPDPPKEPLRPTPTPIPDVDSSTHDDIPF